MEHGVQFDNSVDPTDASKAGEPEATGGWQNSLANWPAGRLWCVL